MLHYNSRVANQFPGVDLNVFRKIHYLELLSQMFGFLFYTFYLIIFLVHGKTFFISEHTFKAIFIIQMITFGAALVIQKFSFMVNSVEYVTYSTFPFIPKFVISICDRLVTAQMPLYWFVVSAFLIIQIAQFANQNPRGIKLAHTYLIPYGIIITLISFITPDHMKLFMIVVCFLIWWIYRKHMIAQLYSQDMTARDVLNMRRMNIWLSSQIFGTLIFHLLDLGMMLAIKSSVTDTGRQTYYGFYKNEVTNHSTNDKNQ
ncbi:Brp/Blh family beta-carotene 15,15'-monooxygenase [Caenorhabditis elegans]|uniref:Brp/Blh family beta-carotene 15,15'-monooxygenase n=1 Tax=Caenorhabditis elegans TaxID=6239 RepID=Q20333_CAEEL|nr:Brp/Blh family beta-carotene 15,15'-monooxygenase [Caenorhabditis elegans]CAA91465.1 Brp/Blh family beta-carotene 15,15'-monooxygenase [Caenorhabditis elegans]|eukprot:NP_509905.1 Uncharacterized protein CELE_F42E11.3 [Caenorhabditis elegans]